MSFPGRTDAAMERKRPITDDTVFAYAVGYKLAGIWNVRKPGKTVAAGDSVKVCGSSSGFEQLARVPFSYCQRRDYSQPYPSQLSNR